jgi:hypothetical protein
VLRVIGVLIILGGLGYMPSSRTSCASGAGSAGARDQGRPADHARAARPIGSAGHRHRRVGEPGTLGALPPEQRVLNAIFESVTLRTAGFSALDTGALLQSSIFVVMALMFIGGASGSTAGGIKVNTFSVLLIAIVSTARGLPSAMAFGRRIQHVVVYRALAVALLSIAVPVRARLPRRARADSRPTSSTSCSRSCRRSARSAPAGASPANSRPGAAGAHLRHVRRPPRAADPGHRAGCTAAAGVVPSGSRVDAHRLAREAEEMAKQQVIVVGLGRFGGAVARELHSARPRGAGRRRGRDA